MPSTGTLKNTGVKSRGSWLIFILYCIATALLSFRHEPWGDELQTWDTIKGSEDFLTLLTNTRYDGHPPLWYMILFALAKFTHSLYLVQCIAFITACGVAFLLVFYSGLPLIVTTLTLAGYYFMFEYSLFSRNYAIAVLIAFLMCSVIKGNFNYRLPVYYVLLFLLCNAHFFAVFLALGFHAFFLYTMREKGQPQKRIIQQAIIGMLVILLCLWFIFIPSELAPYSANWLKSWDKGRLFVALQSPLRAFIPVPAFWKLNFWNTNAIWELAQPAFILKLVAILVSAGTLCLAFFILAKSKKAILLFSINLVCMLGIAVLFPLSNARYVGFIYIGFLISLWLNRDELFSDSSRRKGIYSVLVLQAIASLVVVPQEWCRPFSQVKEIRQILESETRNQELITDYWGLNFLSAAMDQPYYCVENKAKMSYLKMSSGWRKSLENTHRYTEGTLYFLDTNRLDTVLFMCIMPPQELNLCDDRFNKTFRVKLLTARMDAIEKFSNFYLYRVSRRFKMN